jgi:hypothetical protein
MLQSVHKAERVFLGLWASIAGIVSVLTIILPQHVAKEIYGHSLSPQSLIWTQLNGGARLALALVAVAAATTPRPPKVLGRALVIGLIASVVGPVFSSLTGMVPWAEMQPLKFGLWLDGLAAAALLGVSVVRANLAPLPK